MVFLDIFLFVGHLANILKQDDFALVIPSLGRCRWIEKEVDNFYQWE